MLLRIEAQCHQALWRETERFAKIETKINQTYVRVGRFGGVEERGNYKGSFKQLKDESTDVYKPGDVWFSDVRSNDRVLDVAKFQRLTEQIAEARRNFSTISGRLRSNPSTISLDSSLPSGISNLIIQRNELLRFLETDPSKVTTKRVVEVQSRINKLKQKLEGFQEEIATIELGLVEHSSNLGSAPQRVVMQWSDAEELARDYLRWLGYSGVRCTGESADGGVDVEGKDIVAQVKMHNRPTGRPEIQRLFGIAAAQRKKAVFFAMAYSVEAKAWADKAPVALYQFRRDGSVLPVSSAANGFRKS